ncbi:type II secretion system F family protein [bacterium]|nr:type II secretion system F family protein [bacterium]
MLELSIVALVFSAVFFGVISFASLAGITKHPMDERIARLNGIQPGSKRPESDFQSTDFNMIAKLGKKLAPKEIKQRTDSKRRLTLAGYYSDAAYFVYWGARLILMISPAIAIPLIYILIERSLLDALLPIAFTCGLGMFLPDVFLFFVKRQRQENIFCGLPDALDLLVVCIEAGLGLDAAMQKISQEFHMSNPTLSREFQITCAAIRLGQEREMALRELGDRTGVADLKSLTCVLIQADKFGSSLATALRVHSDDMRTRRKQRAEEKAAKTTVKLIFPLVLFIFPAIFVVLGGPAVIKIIDTFMNMNH